jgi:hypothetical protein
MPRADDEQPGPEGGTALDHLQAAALELIAAARSMLDAAEEVVHDPDALRQAAGALSHVAKIASKAGRAAVGVDDAGQDDDPIEHINVD